MENSTHITMVEAISWIAFRNFSELAKHLTLEDTLKKWKVSDKDTLLACLTAIKNNEPWSATEWLKKTNYDGAELSREWTEGFIKKSGQPVAALIADLTKSIEDDKQVVEKIKMAEGQLLESLRGDEIVMRGMQNGGTGNVDPVPSGVLLRDDIFLNLLDNRLSFSATVMEWNFNGLSPEEARRQMASSYRRSTTPPEWENLKIKKADVVGLWHDSDANTEEKILPRSIESSNIVPPNARGWIVKKDQNPYFETPYIKAIEAIMWIVFREWVTYEEVSARYAEKDIFWINPFETPVLSGILKNFYGIPKKRMLGFIEARLEGKQWDEIKSEGTDPQYLEKLLQAACDKFQKPVEDIAKHLRQSVALEDEWCSEIQLASEALKNAALSKELTLLGKKGRDWAILEEIPTKDLMNGFIEPAGNQLMSPDKFWWKDLQVEKAKVGELWEKPVFLSFKSISDQRRLRSDLTPDDTMQEFVQAFFRGDFDRNGESLISRPRDICSVDNSTGIGPEPITRRGFISSLNGNDWQKFLPRAWDGTDTGLSNFALVGLKDWPETTRRLHFEQWCLLKEDFQAWKNKRQEEDDGGESQHLLATPIVKLKKNDEKKSYSEDKAIEFCVKWIQAAIKKGKGCVGREKFRQPFKDEFGKGQKESDAIYILANNKLNRKRGSKTPAAQNAGLRK